MKNFKIQTRALFAALFMMSSFMAFSQVEIGLRAGATFGNWSLAEDTLSFDKQGNIGPNITLLAEIPITSTFGVRPEISYVQKGAKTSVDGIYDINQKHNHLQLGVLLRAQFGDVEGMRGFIGVSPWYSFALGGKAVGTLFGDDIDETIKFGDEDDIFGNELNATDYGLNFALGAYFPAGNGDIILDLRYDFGLGNINSKSDENPENDRFNRYFSATVGYKIPLGGE